LISLSGVAVAELALEGLLAFCVPEMAQFFADEVTASAQGFGTRTGGGNTFRQIQFWAEVVILSYQRGRFAVVWKLKSEVLV